MHPGVYSLTLGCISFYSYSRLSFNRQSRRIGAAAAIALLLRSREEKRHRAGAYVRTGYRLIASVKYLALKALLFKQGNKRFRVLGRVGMGNAYIRLFIGGKRTVSARVVSAAFLPRAFPQDIICPVSSPFKIGFMLSSVPIVAAVPLILPPFLRYFKSSTVKYWHMVLRSSKMQASISLKEIPLSRISAARITSIPSPSEAA